MSKQLNDISKFISLVLRHKPEEIGLQLDESGWADVQELIEKVTAAGIPLDEAILHTIVSTNDKKRFAFNENKTKIRASQGHSIPVDLGLKPVIPPDTLYHGTTIKFLESILQTGLQKQSRQQVHLSATIDTAHAVGSRHGKPVILIIDAKAMHEACLKFYLSSNLVWLTDEVPIQFISQ